jgi:hypothetical protein
MLMTADRDENSRVQVDYALMIRSTLEGRKVKAPPVLFETYQKVLEPFAEPAAEH